MNVFIPQRLAACLHCSNIGSLFFILQGETACRVIRPGRTDCLSFLQNGQLACHPCKRSSVCHSSRQGFGYLPSLRVRSVPAIPQGDSACLFLPVSLGACLSSLKETRHVSLYPSVWKHACHPSRRLSMPLDSACLSLPISLEACLPSLKETQHASLFPEVWEHACHPSRRLSMPLSSHKSGSMPVIGLGGTHLH